MRRAAYFALALLILALVWIFRIQPHATLSKEELDDLVDWA